MKFILSISIILVSFLASANSDVNVLFQNSNSTETLLYPGGPGANGKKGKRTNKKRKRKCAKWSRKGFAG